MKKIIITTGDHNGIGLEVTAKSLNEIGPKNGFNFTIFISDDCKSNMYLDLIKKKFNLKQTSILSNTITETNVVTLIKSSQRPTFWIENTLNYAKKNPLHALVTGPLSKTESYETHNVKGHNDLFRQFYKKSIYMCFMGKFFNTLLLTDHTSLRRALNEISIAKYQEAISYLKFIKLKNNQICLLGINPHAGENGLMGQEEIDIIKPFIAQYNLNSPTYNLSDPIPADTAFLKDNWEKYAMYICPFHDIGLSSFKTIHGLNDGIQVSLGLPFLRTSVDHGTAFNLFNKDIADYGSMKMSLEYAINNI